MAKIWVGIVVGVVVLGAVVQLVVPGVAERRAESKLEEDGGTAVVDIKSFPAVRLLWGSGDRFEARGRGLRLELDERIDDPLGKLEGFDEVDISLDDLTAGPVDVQQFALVRGEDDTSYYLRMLAETTPVALAEAVGGQIGGDLGSLIGSVASSTLPDGGETEIPVDIEGQLTRDDGGAVNVDTVRASVAGVPAGPLAELMVQAVVDRL